jgi:hypothetical protein
MGAGLAAGAGDGVGSEDFFLGGATRKSVLWHGKFVKRILCRV